MNEAVIEVRNLSVSYKVKGGLIRVVDNVSARFEKGEVTALIGESGCGKSTLTAAMLGILPMSARISPESQILFNGENILNQEKEAGRLFRWQKASMVFQAAQSAWNPTLRLGEQLMDSIFDHQPGCSVSTAEAKEL